MFLPSPALQWYFSSLCNLQPNQPRCLPQLSTQDRHECQPELHTLQLEARCSATAHHATDLQSTSLPRAIHPFQGRTEGITLLNWTLKSTGGRTPGGDWLCAFPRGLTDRHRTPTRRWGRAQGTALRVEQQRGTDRVLRHSSDLTDALPFSHFRFGFLQKLLMYYHQQLLLLPPLAPWILKDIWFVILFLHTSHHKPG